MHLPPLHKHSVQPTELATNTKQDHVSVAVLLPPTQSKTVCQWLSCCHQHKARTCAIGCLVATNTKQERVSVAVLLPPTQNKNVCQWLSCCHQHKARPCVSGCLVATNTKQDDVSVAVLLPAGYRLPQNSTPDSVYRLMLRCWEYTPEKRPHFKDIHESLNDALRRMT